MRVVTDVECGMRWTRRCRRTSDVDADGEVVWSWRPLAGVKLATMLCIAPMTVTENVTDTGESTKETVKTIRAGKAGSCSVEPVVTTARMLLHFACEAAGAASTRLSPRPLSFEGRF